MSTYEALKYDFTGANITDISATPLAPTEGTWTPSFSEGSYANINGKYQKFGRLVFCQAEFQMTTASPDDNSSITMAGLPFTSQSFASGGGYSNNWFIGTGYFYSMMGTDTPIYVKDNSTTWSTHDSSATRNGWRLTQYYNTTDKGVQKSDSWRGIKSGTTDKEWAWLAITYLAAS